MGWVESRDFVVLRSSKMMVSMISMILRLKRPTLEWKSEVEGGTELVPP